MVIGASAAQRVTLAKTAPATVTTSSSLIYTLNLGNEGTADVAGGMPVVVTNQLPAGTTFVSAAPVTLVTSVSCAQGSPLLTCTVVLSTTISAGTVAASGPSFAVTVTASSSTGSITNYASVAEDGISAPPTPGAACTTASCASATTLVTASGSAINDPHLEGANGVYGISWKVILRV